MEQFQKVKRKDKFFRGSGMLLLKVAGVIANADAAFIANKRFDEKNNMKASFDKGSFFCYTDIAIVSPQKAF